MFDVSALLLDDALLKCVVTEVVLFSIVAFKTMTFHKTVQRHTRGEMGCLVILSQIFSWFWQRKSVLDEVKAYKNLCQFLGHPVQKSMGGYKKVGSVTMRTESYINGATTLSRMNFSG